MNTTPQPQSTPAKPLSTKSMKVTVSVQVNGTPEAVFDYLADYRNQAKWNKRLSGMEKVTAGPIGQDTTFLLKSKKVVKGQRLEAKFVISQYERPRKVSVLTDQGMMAMHDTYTIEAQGDTVKVSQETKLESFPIVNVFFLIMSPIGYLTNRRTLQKFKRVFETRNI